MDAIEKPREIKIENPGDYKRFENHFKNPKYRWKKARIGYLQEAHTIQNHVTLKEDSLKIGGMSPYEENRLRKMVGEKSGLAKLIKGAKGLFSLAQTNAKRTYNLE